MKIAYLDCASGVSGDMMLGALVDAGVPLESIAEGVQSLGLEQCRLVQSEVKRHGFRAAKLRVEHPPEHKHRHLHHITAMIDASRLTDRQKDLSRRMFQRLAEAEAKVHGSTVDKVHFHEVGAVDSIADIVGTAIGWDLLGAQRLVCSPVPTGRGMIEIAHGRVSIPAPATAELLAGVPLASSEVECELTTPTGAAILAALVDEFGPLPAMRIERIGYGAGDHDLREQPNVLRLLVGQAMDGPAEERLWMLETNVDDATGQVVGHCTLLLLEFGALDVYTTPIQMKKGRPGVLLSVLCAAEDCEPLATLMLRETTTLGVRRWPVMRRKLQRQAHTVQTLWGPVSGKVAMLDGRVLRFAPEYESCRQLAATTRRPLREIYEAAVRAFDLSPGEAS